MKTIEQYGQKYTTIEPAEFHKLAEAYLEEIGTDAFLGAPRFTAQAFRWYCYEYFGMTPAVLAHELSLNVSDVGRRFLEMKEAATDNGTTPSMLRGYNGFIEAANEIATNMGLKPRSIFHMAPFDREYQQWLVALEFDLPNAYVDTSESTPFVANEILDEIEGMSRHQAIRFISQNYGVYKL